MKVHETKANEQKMVVFEGQILVSSHAFRDERHNYQSCHLSLSRRMERKCKERTSDYQVERKDSISFSNELQKLFDRKMEHHGQVERERESERVVYKDSLK